MPSVTGYTTEAIDDMFDGVNNILFNRQTTNYTLISSDARKYIEMDIAGANDLTVPPNVDVPIVVGTWITVVQRGAGLTTIVPGSGVTIHSLLGLDSAGQYSEIRLLKVATNEWYAFGDLTT